MFFGTQCMWYFAEIWIYRKSLWGHPDRLGLSKSQRAIGCCSDLAAAAAAADGGGGGDGDNDQLTSDHRELVAVTSWRGTLVASSAQRVWLSRRTSERRDEWPWSVQSHRCAVTSTLTDCQLHNLWRCRTILAGWRRRAAGCSGLYLASWQMTWLTCAPTNRHAPSISAPTARVAFISPPLLTTRRLGVPDTYTVHMSVTLAPSHRTTHCDSVCLSVCHTEIFHQHLRTVL